MNSVHLLGRLTKDPDVRYRPSDGLASARFNVAISRGKKDGKDLGADFIPCVCFGKTAELVEKYFVKGSQIALDGSLHSGSYEKDGKTVYTLDVLISRLTFIYGAKVDNAGGKAAQNDDVPEGFTEIDSDIPF